MKIRLKADPIQTSSTHMTTTFKVLDKDMVVIEEFTTTTEDKYEAILTIPDNYDNEIIYGTIIYNLDTGPVSDGLVSLTGKAEDIIDYYPPEYKDIFIHEDVLHLNYKDPKTYLSLTNEPLELVLSIRDTVTQTTIYDTKVLNSLSLSLMVIPKHVTVIDVIAYFTLNNKRVSNMSRRSIVVNPNNLTISSTEYTVGEEFELQVNLGSFGYIDTSSEKLFCAKAFGKDRVFHMRPRADDATKLVCTIDEELVNPMILLKGMIGNTLIEEKIQLTKKG